MGSWTSTDETNDAFELILSLAKKLTSFTFELGEVIETGQLPSIDLPLASRMYSSLTKLVVNVNSFDECLTLLDGRFESLSDFAIHVPSIDDDDDDELDQMVSVLRYLRSMTQAVVSVLGASTETEAFPLDFVYHALLLQESRRSTAPSTVSRRRAESTAQFHAANDGTSHRWASPSQRRRRPSSSAEAIPVQSLHPHGQRERAHGYSVERRRPAKLHRERIRSCRIARRVFSGGRPRLLPCVLTAIRLRIV